MTATDSLRWFKSSYSDNGGNCIEVCGWIKSSYSNNGGDCIEVCGWSKASYSNNGGQCIEVATNFADSHDVAVRDSKNPGGPVLVLTATAFAGLVEFAKRADA
ncbi:DUF397 domain-containing protein [Streptomyces sp. NPDC001415]